MWESPIYQYTTDIQTKIENDIMTCVASYGIDVDKEELLKALAYDRDQYDKGYTDGYRDAMERIRSTMENVYNALGSMLEKGE